MSCSRRSVSNPNVFWLALWEAMIRQIPTLRQIFDSSAHRLASLLLRSTAWHSSMMTAMPGRSGVGWNPRCEGSVAPMARFSVARASAMASRADSMSDHSSRQNALWSAIWEMKLDEAPPWPSAYHSTVWSLEARDRARVSSTTVLPEPVPPMTRPDHIESPPVQTDHAALPSPEEQGLRRSMAPGPPSPVPHGQSRRTGYGSGTTPSARCLG